jgi:4-hydroxybenzoyl-CoA thioesterase
MLVNRRTLRIAWGDCDPAGIVFYPRCFALFDASTAALSERALALSMRELRKVHRCVGFPMVDTRARFLVPSRHGDEVTIATRVTALRTSSFDAHHRLLKGAGGGEPAVEGFETRVWVVADPEDPERLKAHPLPAAVIAALGDSAPERRERLP